MDERLAARIAQLEKERDAFATEANQRLIAYGAVIAELKRFAAECVAAAAQPTCPSSDQCAEAAVRPLPPADSAESASAET